MAILLATYCILTGILPIEAQIHLKALVFFNNVYHQDQGFINPCQDESSIEKKLTVRQLIVKADSSNSWFICINNILRKYDIKEASTYLESPISKSKWNSIVKSNVREYWSSHIHTMFQMYSSLQFLNSKNIYKGNVHPILKHKYYSALNIDRIRIKLRIVTGTYVLQTKIIKFYRDESDPTYLLCGNAKETIQHFILDCQKLKSERTKILMEISATWQNIQNCEMSFIELDSISQLQILLDSSNYNKVKIDPTNATRIELLAIRLLFRLHIRAKLLEFDVKR